MKMKRIFALAAISALVAGIVIPGTTVWKT